jgi:hypothetical protein
MTRRILLVLFCLLAFVSIGLFAGISNVNMDAGFVYAQY